MGAGIRAYHGSPHDFDRFDMSKIGTGEGAQAYGHGLYFAENPAVAREYRDALTSKQNLSDAAIGLDREALKYINAHGSVDAARAAVDLEIKQWADSPRAVAQLQALRNAIREPNPGRMYEVNINAAPEQFLDWDRPLVQQPEAIQKLRYPDGPIHTPMRTANGGGPLGSEIYEQLEIARHRPGQGHRDREAATDALREAGIPGIKYLDQGSRGNVNTNDIRGSISMFEGALRKHPNDEMLARQLADAKAQLAAAEREATSNYVVFDDKIIEILRKYGLAGLAAMPALANAPQLEQAQ
jgi:hypothetical protein